MLDWLDLGWDWDYVSHVRFESCLRAVFRGEAWGGAQAFAFLASCRLGAVSLRGTDKPVTLQHCGRPMAGHASHSFLTENGSNGTRIAISLHGQAAHCSCVRFTSRDIRRCVHVPMVAPSNAERNHAQPFPCNW